MNNEIDITKLRLAKCSECPFICKGQLYCTRYNEITEYDIKTVGNIKELQEEYNGKTK